MLGSNGSSCLHFQDWQLPASKAAKLQKEELWLESGVGSRVLLGGYAVSLEWSSRPALANFCREQGCGPLPNNLGLPGRKPISPVPPVLPEALRTPGQHPSPPCGTSHGLQPTLRSKSLRVTSRGSPSPTANILVFSLPESSRDWEGGSSAQTASLTQEGTHPCPSLWGTRRSEIGSSPSPPVLF